jgi:transcription elongation GreA/GreB family factor
MVRMSTDKLYLLPEDRQRAESRIVELEAEIQNLGPQFHEALTQSNETWHDNAPFDALREHQSVLAAELQSLREMLRNATPGLPKLRKDTVGIGSVVTVIGDTGKKHIYKIAGYWTPNAGGVSGDTVTISSLSPIARALLGQKLGSRVSLPPRGKQVAIDDITS